MTNQPNNTRARLDEIAPRPLRTENRYIRNVFNAEVARVDTGEGLLKDVVLAAHIVRCFNAAPECEAALVLAIEFMDRFDTNFPKDERAKAAAALALLRGEK